ncbi:uncharacterized protein LOC110449941 [Mizuhopecten yessoensis]|uniref:uncharacterized protein LOC110449941 n=1 Tax=Mizuhopecten yessoensis TaxID=6573 RepID=UPI000B45D9BE|nr:uncharacterized protein LOC110449941 [Mizuhopecten yessoensis]
MFCSAIAVVDGSIERVVPTSSADPPSVTPTSTNPVSNLDSTYIVQQNEPPVLEVSNLPMSPPPRRSLDQPPTLELSVLPAPPADSTYIRPMNWNITRLAP